MKSISITYKDKNMQKLHNHIYINSYIKTMKLSNHSIVIMLTFMIAKKNRNINLKKIKVRNHLHKILMDMIVSLNLKFRFVHLLNPKLIVLVQNKVYKQNIILYGSTLKILKKSTS